MAAPLGRLALIPLLLITACHQPVSSTQAGPVPFAVNQQQVVDNTTLEISRSALEYNIHKVQQLLADKTRMCAILKGDAYGHDLSLVTPVMMQNGVQCIGIASNEEIRTVRQSGYTSQLMRVRNATEKEMRQAADFDTEELIGNLDMAKRLSAIAQEKGKIIRIHLALNSGGMSRNGLEVSTAAGLEEARAISALPGLKIVGIMSHFTLHVANTFATLTVPESWLDMVRVGGIFYGDTIASTEYKRVMTFKSAIASVNHYPKGNTVGYDRTYTLKRDSVLANIPTGYADGYRRVFSNAGHVLIRGQRVPVLGKTSMNTVIVDVTDLPQVASGDEVVLFGKQGNAQVSAEEVEEISGALFTEMSILWGATNKRVIVD